MSKRAILEATRKRLEADPALLTVTDRQGRSPGGCKGKILSKERMGVAPSRLLPDTQVFLWWRTDSRRLTTIPRNAIATADLARVGASTRITATRSTGC